MESENNNGYHNQKIIAIRRENKNKWERRVALVPEDCKKLIEMGIKIIMQSSALECYTDKQYLEVGVELCDDISNAHVIVGVKEVPLDSLIKNKTFIYFSHTIKGQPLNMPALRDILKKNIRLIDYECIKENEKYFEKPDRLVAFGRFAGLAGALDFLQGLGDFLIHKQITTPFIYTGYSYMFPTLEEAKDSFIKVGELIKTKKLPKELCPFIIGITGNGRVSKGTQEILMLLPHEFIEPDNLISLFENDCENAKTDRVYLTVIHHSNMYEHIDPNVVFDKTNFYQNPNAYKSNFAEKFIPYLSVIFHCMFWNSKSPKILTLDEAHNLSLNKKFRVLGISDITCDLNGSIELLQKFTSIESPFYTIDPLTNIIASDFRKISDSSILYHAVDHLPAELPIDASNHFSEKLYPFMKSIVNSNYPSDLVIKDDEIVSDLPVEILNACETWNGKLMPKYNYLYKELGKHYSEFKDINKNEESF